jgi:hypothetical protein
LIWYSKPVLDSVRTYFESNEQEVAMERNEEVVILDAGSETFGLIEPEAFCCYGAFTFLMM